MNVPQGLFNIYVIIGIALFMSSRDYRLIDRLILLTLWLPFFVYIEIKSLLKVKGMIR